MLCNVLAVFKKHEAVCGLYGEAYHRKKIYTYICIFDIWNVHDTHRYIYGEDNFNLGRYSFLFAKYL